MKRVKYNARHILLDDQEDANEILSMLGSGESFNNLAREYSNCPSGKNGGELGEFYSGSMVAQFERALYHLEINEVSKPIKTEFGFHIIQRLQLKEDKNE